MIKEIHITTDTVMRILEHTLYQLTDIKIDTGLKWSNHNVKNDLRKVLRKDLI